MASTPASSEDRAVPEELHLTFDAIAQMIGLDIAAKRVRQLKKTPKGATLDPQKSRERLAVAQALEEGLGLGAAIRARVTGHVKANETKYMELYRAFTVGGAAPFWQAVARADRDAERVQELVATGEFTLDAEEFARRCSTSVK
jgi:hypothetical protein